MKKRNRNNNNYLSKFFRVESHFKRENSAILEKFPIFESSFYKNTKIPKLNEFIMNNIITIIIKCYI